MSATAVTSIDRTSVITSDSWRWQSRCRRISNRSASVTSTLGCVSAEVFCAHCPRLVGQILEAAVALRSFGVDYVFDWPGLFAEAQFKRQKELQSNTYDVVAAHLFATVPDADRIDMADAGGGGGRFAPFASALAATAGAPGGARGSWRGRTFTIAGSSDSKRARTSRAASSFFL